VPDILDEAGKPFYQGKAFEPGKDDVIRDAKGGGYVVAVGECVYRALDAVIRLQEQGTKVGLINKSTLNIFDDATMKKLAASPFVLVAEGWNAKTGLGSRMGTELLKRGFKGKYNNIGTHLEGCGGLWEQMGYQGLDSEGIQKSIKALAS
jgi:transketolase C-terminal domain/subunit